MKINTNNATIIANINGITAIGTQIVVVASSVSSFASMVLRWRSDDMRGNYVVKPVVERSVIGQHLDGFMGQLSHCLLASLSLVQKPALLKPAAANQTCCANRTTPTGWPRTA